MRTGRFLLLTFAVLALLAGLAYTWYPKKDFGGKIPIVWVSDNNPVRAAQIEAFNRENPDLHLYLDYNNVGTQKIILQCTSGVGPDLFDYGEYDQQSYVETGILWDVTEAAERMNFSVTKQGWPAGQKAGLCFGKQYGYYSNTGTQILIYNKNVFDYFDVPYPKELLTWEEFQALCAKVGSPAGTRANSRIFPLADGNWKIHFQSQRGEYFTEEGLLNLRDPKFANALQWHKDQLFKYRTMPSSLDMKQMSSQGGWGSGSINHLAAGRFAMMFNGDYSLVRFTESYREQVERSGQRKNSDSPLDKPLRLGASLLPYVAGEAPCYGIGARLSGINMQSRNREHALRVLQYFAGPTYSKLINEGMDWLPGNPAYADLGVTEENPALSRIQMHEMTKKAMSYGYVPRSSEFLLMTDVNRVILSQISRMESNSDIPVENLVAAAEKELESLLKRNLQRSPALKMLYDERVQLAEARNNSAPLSSP